MRRLPADQLPKGTARELSLLLKRCRTLDGVGVRMPKFGLSALARVVQFLAVNEIGKPRDQRSGIAGCGGGEA